MRWWLRLPKTLWVFLIGLVLVMVQAVALHLHQRAKEEEAQQELASYSVNQIVSQLQQVSALMRAMSWPAQDARTASQFEAQGQRVLAADELLTSLVLLRRVPDADRHDFEKTFGLPLYDLEQRQRRPSPDRPIHLPIIQQYPLGPNSLPEGLDLASNLPFLRRYHQAVQGTGIVFASWPSATLPTLGLIVPQGTQAASPWAYFVTLDLMRAYIAIQQQQPDSLSLQLQIRDEQAGGQLLLDTRPDTGRLQLRYQRRVMFAGTQLRFDVYAPAPNVDWLGPGQLTPVLLGLMAVLVFTWISLRQEEGRAAEQLRMDQLAQELSAHEQLYLEEKREKTLAEHSLLLSRARQRAILHASTDAILLTDREGQITDVNPAAATLIGQGSARLTGVPIGSVIAQFYVGARYSNFDHCAEQYIGTPFEAQLVCADGSQRPIDISLSRVVLVDGEFYVAVFRDISARKAQEAALIRLKDTLAEQVEVQGRQLAALLDASPLAMAYISDQSFRKVNHAFLELFQHNEDTVLAQDTRLIYQGEEDYLRAERLAPPVLARGVVYQDELPLRCGMGETLWVRRFGKALNPNRPEHGVVWLFQDISAQRATEEALRHAKELAEETSRAKTEFLANMSHELRTPLHAVLGFAEMGIHRQHQSGDAKSTQYFERIHASGSRLLQLLNDLLDLAKMEVGRMEYQFTRHDLLPGIHDTMEEMRAMARLRAVELELFAPAGPLEADVDDFRMGQLLRNLLSNAIKFSPGGGLVAIRLTVLPGHSERVELCVDDAGPGIPPDELEHIFDKFIQSSATKTGAGGTGLGLPICREIIHAHNGEIHASNLEHGGARFRAVFPRWRRT